MQKVGVTMFYFLTEAIRSSVSGIEKSMINRQKLFKKNNVGSRIITRSFNPHEHQNMHAYGLNEFDVINLFDFFQESISFEGKPVTIEDIPKIYDGFHRTKGTKSEYIFRNSSVGRLEIITQSLNSDKVGWVHHFDRNGQPTQNDTYDSRGFLSLRQFMGTDGGVSVEQMYTPSGRLVFSSYYQKNDEGKRVNSLLRLVNYLGQDYFFDNLDQLTSFFYDELAANDGNDTFIGDVPCSLDICLVGMKSKATKLLLMHNTHWQVDPSTGELNANVEYELKHQDDLDGYIFLTEDQKKDFVARCHPSFKTYVIPNQSYAMDILKQRRETSNKTHKITKLINVSRISYQKRLEDVIEIFREVHSSCPEVTLDIWGYSTDNPLKDRLIKKINDLGLQSEIKFKGFIKDLSEVYKSAGIALVTSRFEGLPMSVLEGQTFGVPTVAYDIHYGPNVFINNGVNGYLVESGNKTEFANKLINLINNSSEYESFVKNTFEHVQKWSDEVVWNSWKPIVYGERGIR